MKKREIHQVINIDNLPEDIREHLIKEFDLNPQECNLILIVGDEKRMIIAKNVILDRGHIPKYIIDEE